MPRSLTGAILLTSLALSGCATVLDETLAVATVPYHRAEDGRIIVALSVNGTGPHRFAIDTAASRSVIFGPLRSDLGLVHSPRDVMVQGMVSSGLFPLVRIDQIAIGAADWNNIDVVALPGNATTSATLDGILGLDFLIDYTVVFSTRNRRISLFHPADIAADAYQGWQSIPLEARTVSRSGRSFYFMQLRLGNHKIPAVFDLGAGFNVMNWPAARLIDLSPEYLRKRKADEIAGALGTTPDVFHVGIDRFHTGSMTWSHETFVVGDLPVFEALVDATEPTAIVGSELFLRRDFVIDFTRSRLLINRRPAIP